jgi:multimeric flavodoxin WrbA
MKTKLLAVVASHRKDGNSFTLAKTVLESVDPHPRVLQLATERIESCTVCEKCIDHDCFLDDDLNKVLAEMKRADGVIFVIPKYLTVPSKFLALLERLATIVHIRRHMGYGGEVKNPDYRLFKGKNPSQSSLYQAQENSRRKTSAQS